VLYVRSILDLVITVIKSVAQSGGIWLVSGRALNGRKRQKGRERERERDREKLVGRTAIFNLDANREIKNGDPIDEERRAARLIRA